MFEISNSPLFSIFHDFDGLEFEKEIFTSLFLANKECFDVKTTKISCSF